MNMNSWLTLHHALLTGSGDVKGAAAMQAEGPYIREEGIGRMNSMC